MNDTWLISIGSAIAVALLAGMKILWDRMNAKDGEHKAERKEWVQMIEEIMDRQNHAIKDVSERHDDALRDLAEKYDKRQNEINQTMLEAFRQVFGKR